MDLEKIFKYKENIQNDLSFEEISKMFREILYDEWKELKDDDAIHCYQLTRDMVDIFTQMVNGRKFDENYLKNKIRW